MDTPFVVKEKLQFGREYHGMARGLSMEGLELDTPGSLLQDDRFMWLEFSLADSQERIKALGEIVERQPTAVRVRFKHLYPSDRRKLAIFLDTSEYNLNSH
jgi:hypothetical protein